MTKYNYDLHHAYTSEKQRVSVGLGVAPGDDMVGVEKGSPRDTISTPSQEPPPRTTYGSIINDFADSTTAHGLPRVITEPKWYWKIFWLLVFCGATYIFSRQAWDILSDYRTNPVNTNIQIQTRTFVAFPAVTVCNMNRMRRSKLVGTRFEGLVEIDGGFTDDDNAYSWWFDFSSDFWNEWYSSGYTWGSSGGGGSFGASSGGPGRKKRASPYDNLFQDFESVPDMTDDEIEIEPNPDFKGARKFIHGRVARAGGSLSSSSLGGGGGGGGGGGWSSSFGGGGGGGGFSSSYGGGGGGGFSSSYGGGGGGGGWSSSYVWGTSSSWGWGGYYSSSPYWNSWFDNWDSWGSGLFGSFQFEFDDYYAWDDLVDGESDWQGFYDNSRSDDFSDIADVANPTRQELEEYGHQPEDFILQCTFDKRNCNYTDFKMFQNKVYGNCYTFNQGQNESIIETSKSGSTYGLHLTLFIEQPEYVGIFSQETGVRVAIHDPNVIPLPEDDGITAPTGQAASIGIRQNLIKRQGGKYGNCTEDGAETPYHPDIYSYSTLGCKRACLLDEMYARCGCVNDIVDDLDLTKCSYFNSTQQRCRQLIESLNDEGKLDCYCPNACSEMNYITSTSTSLWPSERYEQHLYTRVASRNDIAARILQSVDSTRKNLARVRIYFEELNFQSVEQIPAYTFGSFLGAVGGLLGLYIGFSVVTLSEIILLILALIKHTFFGACCSNKVQPVHT